MKKLKENIRLFLTNDKVSGKWFRNRYLEIYLRKSDKQFDSDGFYQMCICISSVTMFDKYEGKGYFTILLNNLEELALDYNRYIYVEVGHDPRLIILLASKGYSLIPYYPLVTMTNYPLKNDFQL